MLINGYVLHQEDWLSKKGIFMIIERPSTIKSTSTKLKVKCTFYSARRTHILVNISTKKNGYSIFSSHGYTKLNKM